ncbi:hypothetical protein DL771_004742 [Monosporascus sp. 5C6A]|nr:hypothetical protein DL771_004742 [Monosporascus sp. 5C6A]
MMDACKDFFAQITEPLIFMGISLAHAPRTIFDIITSGEWWKLWSLDAFKEALFGNFWATMGPNVKAAAEGRVIPLLEGRISGGQIRDHVVTTPINGTVIEVGAGSGMWADVFARIGAGAGSAGATSTGHHDNTNRSDITKIYGVEPNPKSAASLRQRVEAVGLEDVYEVVPVGIESLDKPGTWACQIPRESVDCIASILCLCSIPDPEENIKHLYRLLKPGGHWYVYEHVEASRGGPLLRLYQSIRGPSS